MATLQEIAKRREAAMAKINQGLKAQGKSDSEIAVSNAKLIAKMTVQDIKDNTSLNSYLSMASKELDKLETSVNSTISKLFSENSKKIEPTSLSKRVKKTLDSYMKATNDFLAGNSDLMPSRDYTRKQKALVAKQKKMQEQVSSQIVNEVRKLGQSAVDSGLKTYKDLSNSLGKVKSNIAQTLAYHKAAIKMQAKAFGQATKLAVNKKLAEAGKALDTGIQKASGMFSSFMNAAKKAVSTIKQEAVAIGRDVKDAVGMKTSVADLAMSAAKDALATKGLNDNLKKSLTAQLNAKGNLTSKLKRIRKTLMSDKTPAGRKALSTINKGIEAAAKEARFQQARKKGSTAMRSKTGNAVKNASNTLMDKASKFKAKYTSKKVVNGKTVYTYS